VVATNAANGYTTYVQGTTLTSGNNVIPALSTQDIARPGVGQFGINLRANANPAVGQNVSGPGTSLPTPDYATQDRFKYVSGASVATAAVADDYRKFTVSYIVNIPREQEIGVYVSTLTFVSLANF
jgi:hypothetical protein